MNEHSFALVAHADAASAAGAASMAETTGAGTEAAAVVSVATAVVVCGAAGVVEKNFWEVQFGFNWR